MEEDRTFRVVEGTSGEKGPFHTLAQRAPRPEEPLTINFRNQGRLVGESRWPTGRPQADTTLSPTAGWGVPVNAIEFSLVERRAFLSGVDLCHAGGHLGGTRLGLCRPQSGNVSQPNSARGRQRVAARPGGRDQPRSLTRTPKPSDYRRTDWQSVHGKDAYDGMSFRAHPEFASPAGETLAGLLVLSQRTAHRPMTGWPPTVVGPVTAC